tara:strand:- start:230 stop:874 length:645 start_codon:yes stop_codon:yes gene_type:complete
MKYFLLVATFLFNASYAQDEWFFNRMMRKERDKVVDQIKSDGVRDFFKASSDFIKIDMTGDGIDEFFRVEMVDGLYYVRILDFKRNDVGRFKFLTKGHSARVYRVLRKSLAKNITITLFYFFEGKTGYLDRYNTGAIYSYVVKDNDFKKAKFQRLSPLWLEKKDFNMGTYKRLYKVGSNDLNGDGISEVIVSHRGIRRIYSYDQKTSSMYGTNL